MSFHLLAYNQERWVRDAVKGALSQSYSPMEIILSDDASTDRTFEIMREEAEAYTGPNTVVLRRNPENLGLAEHLNAVMALTRGSIIVVGAGDDISLPNRVAACVRVLASRPSLVSVCCRTRTIDTEGALHPEWGDASEVYWEPPRSTQQERVKRFIDNWRPLILGGSHAFRRELHDRFGPLRRDVIHEDNVYSFRAHLLGEVDRIEEVGVLYRRHPGTLSRTVSEGSSHWERARSRERARVLAQKRQAELWRMREADLELACRTGAVRWDARRQADKIRRRGRVAALLERQPGRALPGRVADFLSVALLRPSAADFFGGMLRILPPSAVVWINGLRSWVRALARRRG